MKRIHAGDPGQNEEKARTFAPATAANKVDRQETKAPAAPAQPAAKDAPAATADKPAPAPQKTAAMQVKAEPEAPGRAAEPPATAPTPSRVEAAAPPAPRADEPLSPADTATAEAAAQGQTGVGLTVAAARPPAKPLATGLTQGDLEVLLLRFTSSYEAGDVEQFLVLFADDVRTNDRFSKEGLREDYENLFRTTTLRNMRLVNVTWEINGNQARGWGNFEVRVRREGDQDVKTYLGSLTFHVEKVDGRLRIKSMYHGQWKAGAS